MLEINRLERLINKNVEKVMERKLKLWVKVVGKIII